VRVLVTGAAGFVGRAVAARLVQAGHEVTGLVHERSPVDEGTLSGVVYARADVLDCSSLRHVIEHGGYEGVCHLAALTAVRTSFREPLRYFAVNVHGTVNLLAVLAETAAATGQVPRVVFASTAAVYGQPVRLPVTEDHPVWPTSPYGASKVAVDRLLGYHAANGAIGAVSLRCFNIAGAADGRGDCDLTRLIPKAVSVAAGVIDQIVVNGDGSAVREFVHVTDMADAYALALDAVEAGRHEVFNVGSGIGVSIREVLETVERVTGHRVPAVSRPAADEPQALVADSSRIRARLGWRPRRSGLSCIIADTWEAMRCHS
jgi:UDP-glucose 4-epimerase